MTDTKIIKALECHTGKVIEGCQVCPYTIYDFDCLNYLYPDLLDFINRQKAEIYKLQKENSELKNGYFQKHYEEMEHQELMGLRKAFRQAGYDYINLNAEWEGKYEKAKAEAVKEFAEKVKKELSLLKKECRKVLDNDGAFAIDRARKKIDNLVKEMEGEQYGCKKM